MKSLLTSFCILIFMTSLTSQNVGIGTSDPEAKLQISSNSNSTAPHLLIEESELDQTRIRFKNSSKPQYWSLSTTNDLISNDRFVVTHSLKGTLLTITGDEQFGFDVGFTPNASFHIGNGKDVLFGTDKTGSGDKLMFLPNLHAFRVGNLSTGAASTYWNQDSIGVYSFASGQNTRAQGQAATAMGRDTEATNAYAFASGFFTNADGIYSTAMGYNTDAFGEGSTALVYNSDAIGDFTFAAGHFASAEAIYSVALGNSTRAQAYNSTAFGAYNVGGGDATSWVAQDPVFEIGIGQGNLDRSNALTVLKDGRHGILTSSPKANLHVKDNGVAGSRTIVAVLESDISDRPTLLFSEFPTSTINNGMSIEYDGRGGGSSNKMHINKAGGVPALTVENGGNVGINNTVPKANLHIKDDGSAGSGTIVAILESNISNRPILQFSETSAGDKTSGMSIEYNGSESTNRMHINDTDGLPIFSLEDNGQVGIGVPNPSFFLHLPNNSITGKARAHSWTTYSDSRIKSNKQKLKYGLKEVMKMQPLSYTQHAANFENSDLIISSNSENNIGFFAQEIYKIIPEAAVKPEDETEQLWGMEYEKLIPVLVSAVQEQQYAMEKMQTEIELLKKLLQESDQKDIVQKD